MSFLAFLLALPGIFFTWRGLSRWLERNHKTTKAGLYAAYAVGLLIAISASPMLFPSSFRWLGAVGWTVFILVGIKHFYYWARAARKVEQQLDQEDDGASAGDARSQGRDGDAGETAPVRNEPAAPVRSLEDELAEALRDRASKLEKKDKPK